MSGRRKAVHDSEKPSENIRKRLKAFRKRPKAIRKRPKAVRKRLEASEMKYIRQNLVVNYLAPPLRGVLENLSPIFSPRRYLYENLPKNKTATPGRFNDFFDHTNSSAVNGFAKNAKHKKMSLFFGRFFQKCS